MSTYAVIIAGGSATRLWPATRQARPKQFQRLAYDRPLLVETVERLRPVVPPERMLVVTSAAHEAMTAEMLPDVPPSNIIGEPVARNTLGAVGLGAARVAHLDSDATVGFFPADHFVGKPEQLQSAIRFGMELAQRDGSILIGIRPIEPATGYGYIQRAKPVADWNGLTAYRVARFVEKPDAAHARQFVASGDYLWNAGMFIWHIDRLRALFEQHVAGAWDALVKVDDALRRGVKDADAFARVPAIAVDYAIVEKAVDVTVIETACDWRDLGDWAALLAALPRDADGNAIDTDGIAIDSRNSLFRVPAGKAVAAIGVEDLIIVDSGDALFVCRRDRAQDVRLIVEALRARGRTDLL